MQNMINVGDEIDQGRITGHAETDRRESESFVNKQSFGIGQHTYPRIKKCQLLYDPAVNRSLTKPP